MNVEDTDGDEDWESDQQHREEEVLAEQRNRQGGWGNNLGQKQEEHSEGEKNGDAEGHLKQKCDKFCRMDKLAQNLSNSFIQRSANYVCDLTFKLILTVTFSPESAGR